MALFQQQWNQFRELLAKQVDATSLAMFRIFFGLLMFVHAVKYLYPQNGTSLKDFLYHDTTFNFTYPGLSWIQPFPEPLWTLFFCLMALAALGVAFGVFYRFAAGLLCVSYSYIFLTEVAKYNNHYYLMCLLALLLFAMPADRRFSIAAWRRQKQVDDKLASVLTVPFWTIFLLRAQLFVLYFYGGIAKLDSDWLTGIPMISKGREVLDLLTPWLAMPQIDPIYVALFICWFGLFYDLMIGFLLVWRRTRWFAIGLVAAFHLSNHFLFPIGIFPALAFLATLIFFEPDWPVRFYRWLRAPSFRMPNLRLAGIGIATIPPLGFLLGWKDRVSGFSQTDSKIPQLGTIILVCYLFGQVAFPLRHYFIDGDAKWTEEGQEFSWRMMLRSKDASHLVFHVADQEMMHLDLNRRVQFDWSRWPQKVPKTVYVPVESSLFQWQHHPGLTATYEPNVGTRVIYRLSANENIDEKKRQLADQWKTLFKRDVQVVQTIGFDEAIEQLETNFRHKNKLEQFQPAIDRLRDLLPKAKASDQSQMAKEIQWATLVNELEALLHTDERDEIQSVLRHLHPFLIQGGSASNERFLVVDDREINAQSCDPEKITGGGEFLVWVDLGRLRPKDWKSLPQWFVTFENRDLKIVWNFANDLNSIQKNRFTTKPQMIHQFAGHIANRWESITGRRPKVQAVSHVMMNYRTPQPLIDPSVDLASVEYKLFEHNRWIVPLKSKVGSASVYRARQADPRQQLR